jgi:hypothetical protein
VGQVFLDRAVTLSKSLSQRERAGPAAQRWEGEGLRSLPLCRRAVGRRTPSPQPSPHGRGISAGRAAAARSAVLEQPGPPSDRLTVRCRNVTLTSSGELTLSSMEKLGRGNCDFRSVHHE